MGLYFDSGLLLFDSNNVAMHADCCCGGETCGCCTGEITGIQVTVTGYADLDPAGSCADCPPMNATYCIPPDVGDGCTGIAVDIGNCGNPNAIDYAITDQGATCLLTVTLTVDEEATYGELSFTDGDDCDTISGTMTMFPQGGLWCDATSVAFEVDGLCTP